MALSASRTFVQRVLDVLKRAQALTRPAQVDLRLHRDMWLGNRKAGLEKNVRHYSF